MKYKWTNIKLERSHQSENQILPCINHLKRSKKDLAALPGDLGRISVAVLVPRCHVAFRLRVKLAIPRPPRKSCWCLAVTRTTSVAGGPNSRSVTYRLLIERDWLVSDRATHRDYEEYAKLGGAAGCLRKSITHAWLWNLCGCECERGVERAVNLCFFFAYLSPCSNYFSSQHSLMRNWRIHRELCILIDLQLASICILIWFL